MGIVLALPDSTEQNTRSGFFIWVVHLFHSHDFWFLHKELGQDLYVMKWLRYTGFIVLYPVGVASELAMIYLALPAIRSSRMWSFDMPNAYNMAFDYHIMCCISMFIYVPGEL